MNHLRVQFNQVIGFLRNLGMRRIDNSATTRGREVTRERNMDLIAMLHVFRTKGSIAVTVDEQTWRDLAMDEVFAKLDRTAGMPGQQMLYHQLRTYEDDLSVLQERARQYDVFRSDLELCGNIQAQMTSLEGQSSALLAPLLLSPLPKPPNYSWMFFLCSALTLACLMGVFISEKIIIPTLGMIIFNLVINELYGRKVTPYLPAFSRISALLRICKRLSSIDNEHHLPQLKRLRSMLPQIENLGLRFRWIGMDRTHHSEMTSIIFGYLNLFLLFDIVMFLLTLPMLRQHQSALIELLETVGSLDASISVASYLADLPAACVPNLTKDRKIDVVGLFHPLLSAPVGNSFESTNRSGLITGSNMAGKTTFIRTVGINVILAQTIHICLAKDALLPQAIVRSSIRREDRLNEGESYYFVEIQRIKGFLYHEDSALLHMFLIDEIFRGTNTVERIAASAAVLRHLGQHDLVLVTTHDLELQELLKDTFSTYHFSERIKDGAHGFDYRIYPGSANSRNAIKLLALSGYPEDITQEAGRIAEWVEGIYDRRFPSHHHPGNGIQGPRR